MTEGKNRKLTEGLFLLLYAISFGFFYYKYVPLLPSFQIILIPVLAAVIVCAARNMQKGVLLFVFVFPLINNWPYFFGIGPNIPHASTSLVLFLAFLFGLLLHHIIFRHHLNFDHEMFRPLAFLSLLVFFSGTITFFRYSNFFPFASDRIRELTVNVNGVRAGGAIMSTVFTFLNYATGFLFFGIVYNAVKSREFLKKILVTLSAAAAVTFAFSFFQRFVSPALGNIPFFVDLGRINSTFIDPNSFGLFIAAFLPVLAGMFLAHTKPKKYFFLALIAIALLIFPWTGSRSGLLGLALGTILFLVLSFSKGTGASRKKPLLVLLMLPVVLISFIILFQRTILFERTARSIDALFSKKGITRILGAEKQGNWTVAADMIAEFPISGVGLGAYIVELPNVAARTGLSHIFTDYTDSAENYFLQAGSELGLIGLVAVFWLFFTIFKMMNRSLNLPGRENKDRFILTGLVSGSSVFFISIFFHSYIGAFDVKYFFWLLVGLVAVFPREEKAETGKKQPPGRVFKAGLLVLVIVFGTSNLFLSVTSLSLPKTTELYNLDQNFGLYGEEKDDRDFIFRWTKKEAGISIVNLKQGLIVPIKASHPRIDRHPVHVDIYLSDPVFKKKTPIGRIRLEDAEWKKFEYSLEENADRKVYLVFESDRVWQPRKSLGQEDTRWLGIALGKPWFKPLLIEDTADIIVVNSFPARQWKSAFDQTGSRIEKSSMQFGVDRKDLALRLFVRGKQSQRPGPRIVIRLNDRLIGETVLEESGWTSLVFTPEMDIGEQEIKIECTNGFIDAGGEQGRSVDLGDLELIRIDRGDKIRGRKNGARLPEP